MSKKRKDFNLLSTKSQLKYILEQLDILKEDIETLKSKTIKTKS